MSDSVLVLCSGGVDSAVLLAMAAERGILGGALHIGYWQPAGSQEDLASRALADHYGAPFDRVELPLVGLEPMRAAPGESGPRVVPGRNLLFLALALNRAEAAGHTHVWYGATKDDGPDYPDCRPTFLAGLNRALAAPWGPSSVRDRVIVDAPLIHHTRAQVIAEGDRLGVPWGWCWSCYAPTDQGDPCGACNSCKQLAPTVRR